MTARLIALDGRAVRVAHRDVADVVVVGSGPAGATVARTLAARGVEVALLEEGHEAGRFEASGLHAMARLYRDMGTSIAFGNVSMPYLQGRVVGGTSVVNGAISWNFPREVHGEWASADPVLGEALRYESIAAAEARIETELHVHPTEARVAGPKNLLMARGAEALGVAHRPIRRNVEGCEGLGRCLQGCPHGHKLSMDRTFLPDAVAHGARIASGMRVTRVLVEPHGGARRRACGRVRGVSGVSAAGAPFVVHARHAVVLCASAIQTPCLLRESGLTRGPVGDGLAAHPGVSVTGLFPEPVRAWEGATQGHEVTGYRGEGIKLEALGFDLSILASRVPGVGRDFARRLGELNRYAVWGAALRARARGKVRSLGGRPFVTYSLRPEDVQKARRAVRLLGDALLAAGAREVYPGVPGFAGTVRDRAEMARFEAEGSLVAGDYAMSMTHLFGTARMGSDPARSVVGTDFQHHDVAGLYVADSSVFPSNLGVNPQYAIMALAELAAEHVARA